MPFVALSYDWGLVLQGSLDDRLTASLPDTIEDAVTVTRKSACDTFELIRIASTSFIQAALFSRSNFTNQYNASHLPIY
jgi:hypothetical protein